MKLNEKIQARELRTAGLSIKDIAERLQVAKSSVSIWVRDIELSPTQQDMLASKPFAKSAVEKRRITRLANEAAKRREIQLQAKSTVSAISKREIWLMGVMLYWAEGGKTQRLVRFSNGDPEMITLMMRFFREVCAVPEPKFRGYIHIHPHLDHRRAEKYWSDVSSIPIGQFFKTYHKTNISSQNKKNSLPYGVFDIYVLDTKLFLTICGWAEGIFDCTQPDDDKRQRG